MTRALVVDDDDSIRMVAETALELVGGWEVVSVDGGLAALAAAAEQQLDVILLDVMMPGLDGLETFRRLAADPVTAEIPVILVTAKVQRADHAEWDGLGIAGVIPKPFNPMTLARDIAAMLGWTS